MIGPGKYEDACTAARISTDAEATLLIVFGGNLGTGFSAQMTPGMLLIVPDVLRRLADRIEADRHQYEEMQ